MKRLFSILLALCAAFFAVNSGGHGLSAIAAGVGATAAADNENSAQNSDNPTPIDCTDNPDLLVEFSECYYNGLPQSPEVAVKLGDVVIPKSDYSLIFWDNVEVGSASCLIRFHGDYTGEYQAQFPISKRVIENFEIDVMAKAGQTVSLDLSKLKPVGAIFGNPVFMERDFSESGFPKVAFNVLKFTTASDIGDNSYIAIPVTNMVSYENFWLEFYIEITDKEIPKLTLKPIVKEYDGKPVSVSDIEQSGSYAFIDGKLQEGEWSFNYWTTPPTMPCEGEYFEVEFTPNNAEYSQVYGLIPITISRLEANDFAAALESKSIWADMAAVTVTGIPDDYDGTITVTSNCEEITVLEEYDTSGGKEYEISLPTAEGRYSVKVTLVGSALYSPKTITLEAVVGNPTDDRPADTATTLEELRGLIENATVGSIVKANKTPYISQELIATAKEKGITIEVRANDNITYIVKPYEMETPRAVNLTAGTAVIPQTLIDKTGDTACCSFTTYTGGSGISVKLASDSDLPIACFYLYSTTGELEHISSLPNKGGAVVFPLPQSGKYLLTASQESHVFADLDNDCETTILDLAAAADIYLSVIAAGKSTQDQTVAIDFDGDGEVSILDIVVLADYYLAMF